MERGVKLKNMTTKPDSGISISNYLPPQPVKPNKMSKFKIEKVDHSNFTPNDCCFVTAYYQTSDTLSQTNFIFHENAYLAKNRCTTGIWKPKSLKNN